MAAIGYVTRDGRSFKGQLPALQPQGLGYYFRTYLLRCIDKADSCCMVYTVQSTTPSHTWTDRSPESKMTHPPITHKTTSPSC